MPRQTDCELLELRNKALVRKFHELFDKKRKRMDDVLIELERDWFFIDRKTIYALIFYNEKNNDYYQSLLKNTAKQLKFEI